MPAFERLEDQQHRIPAEARLPAVSGIRQKMLWSTYAELLLRDRFALREHVSLDHVYIDRQK